MTQRPIRNGGDRILMLLSNPYTHDGRVNNEAKALRDAGYEVTVIAWDRKSEYPLEENIEGIRIIRIRNNIPMKLLLYDIFRLRLWWGMAYRRALKLYKEWPFRAVHCHDLDTLPAGVMLKKKLGVRLVYDSHEVWTYMIKGEVPDFLIRRFARMEKNLIGKTDHVITVDEKYREYLLSIGASPEKMTLVMNAKDVVVNEYTPSGNKVPVIVYIGILKKRRFVKELVDAAKERNDIRVLIAGNGDLKEYVSANSGGNIEYLGVIPVEEVLPTTLRSDVVYCLFDPNHPLTRIGSPNKFFEALATGRPIMVARGTFVAERAEKLGCGIVVEPTVEGIKKGMDYIVSHPWELRDMGERALEAAKREFNWPTQVRRLLSVYEGLLHNE